MAEGLLITRRVVPPFGGWIPESAEILLEWAAGKPSLRFSIDALPPQANSMFVHTRKGMTFPTAEAKAFREAVVWKFRRDGLKWQPTGVVMALVFFESPVWLAKKDTVRKADLDNREKALFDALEAATGSPDQNTWAIHAYKIPSPKKKTTVILIDLGPTVDCCA